MKTKEEIIREALTTIKNKKNYENTSRLRGITSGNY